MALPLLILNGPNLNLLGQRDPGTYGHDTLQTVEERCVALGTELGFDVSCHQSNHEGDLVDAIQSAGAAGTAVVFNPGAYSHTSIALRDAISGSGARVVEVHISNIHGRERFRHHSHITPVAVGVIAGLGTAGYELAIRAHYHYLSKTK
ncbi:MAG: type II 3-dehydroquinate dehydratase [Pseudomonadota bacterium]